MRHVRCYPFWPHICLGADVDRDPEALGHRSQGAPFDRGEVIPGRLGRRGAAREWASAYSRMLLEGQLHGGIAQGIAQALWEGIVYDESGRVLSGSLMDYAAPKADALAPFGIAHIDMPLRPEKIWAAIRAARR